MAEKKAESENDEKNTSWWRENVLPLVVALLVILTIRSSVIEPFKIPSGSMLPTILVGDHIFVNKFAYGLKIPFSDLIGDPIHIVEREPPGRGDVVVFLFPKDESIHYVKRIIGVPGDVIEIRDKHVYINGEVLPREKLTESEQDAILEQFEAEQFNKEDIELYRESYAEDQSKIMVDTASMDLSVGPIRVPDGQYFVLGDNRDYSNDSRFWGYVPEKNIKGKALFVWLSMRLDWDEKKIDFNPSRIGTSIH